MDISTLSSSASPADHSSEPVQPAVGIDPALRKKANEAAEKFEAFFIKETLKQMRRSTREMAGEDSMLSNKLNEDMLDLADGFVADAMASQRAFGIADVILRQLIPEDATALKSSHAPVARKA
ncbi:rod-binding protein [Methyloversatilis thermotolerans]|uniref:rod-binding protein n=1 Tax=Methyloversatilis thermotolerans TaxID=1346290 RepID=UPI00036504CD|nr:rod-binding protein [Methyloversatilis thermotolerans]